MLNSNNISGFHSALPLEVHGSGYNQMQMISNSKVKLSLEDHGSGYNQMQMISNSKVKLSLEVHGSGYNQMQMISISKVIYSFIGSFEVSSRPPCNCRNLFNIRSKDSMN